MAMRRRPGRAAGARKNARQTGLATRRSVRRQTPCLRRMRQRRGRAGITRAFYGPVRDADSIHHRLRLSHTRASSFGPMLTRSFGTIHTFSRANSRRTGRSSRFVKGRLFDNVLA
jgi:hypothetical protein